MGRAMKIARRGFLFGSVAILGGVAFGWYRYATPYGNPLEAGLGTGEATLNPYVMIDANGVTVIAPRAEMGQGVHTTLAALVAEEMDLDWSAIRVIHGPASKAYFNSAVLAEGVPFAPTDDSRLANTMRGAMDIPAKFLGLQITGGSSSIPDAFEKMRLAGAAARMALVQAAAARLNLSADQLSTEDGAVLAPDGTRIPYADLAVDAASIDLREEPTLKPRENWRLLGRSLPRTDMLAKVTGTETYAIDLRLPGMRFATVRTNPRLGGEMLSYDASAAEAMPGVERIVPLPNGVAVVAITTWHAMQAADAITFDWGPAPYPATSSEITETLRASFTEDRKDSTNRNDGDVDTILTAEDWQAEYTVPYLAHGTMEPMSGAALLRDGKLTVWAGTRSPRRHWPRRRRSPAFRQRPSTSRSCPWAAALVAGWKWTHCASPSRSPRPWRAPRSCWHGAGKRT
jgi:isoquinoline 1-oxidoreductase beta subunit